MKKIKYKIKMQSIISLVIVISILFLNSFSLVASAYGSDIDDGDCARVYIRNIGSGKYMTVPDGTVSNGKEIKIYEATESKSQQWDVYNLGNGYYCIRSAIDDNYVLSVEDGNDISGAKIVLKYLSDGASIPTSAKFYGYKIDDFQCAFLASGVSLTNGAPRVIDCKNDKQSDGTNLVQYDMTVVIEDCVSQLWSFESYDRSIKLQSWNLVDTGGHCDWDCDTDTYASMVRKAANAWNDYIGDEVFRPDAWNIVQDVTIKELEKDLENKGYYAATYNNDIFENGLQANSIEIYTNAMNELESDLQRQKVVMHEFGHALGLAHNRTKDHAASEKLANIMQQGQLPYSTFISLDDRASAQDAYENF